MLGFRHRLERSSCDWGKNCGDYRPSWRSYDAPENTLTAIRLAWKQGADAAEFDVHLSKDGQIVLMHDKDAKRTGDVARKISEMTLEEIRRLDVGKWKGARFAGEKVPILTEVLATVPAKKRVFIEVKCGPEIIPELRRVVADAKLQPQQTAIISFSPDVVAAVKKALPKLQVYWIVEIRKDKKPTWKLEQLIEKAKEIHADGLDLSADAQITPEFVRQAQKAQLPVYVWTVNDATLARQMLDAGVLGITTDRPEWLRERLREVKGIADKRKCS
ncbi:MAG: glycerophosphodiester phosphodiesterase [Gemmataceae bacterium]|nr:glycerophosphodiester phosphodiesterase [Gemmataceae bacterium]